MCVFWSWPRWRVLMDRDLRSPEVLMWANISLGLGQVSLGATGYTCDAPALIWLQSGSWETIQRGPQFPCSVGCVSSGSQNHQLPFCLFCLRLFFFGQFPYILFPTLFVRHNIRIERIWLWRGVSSLWRSRPLKLPTYYVASEGNGEYSSSTKLLCLHK